jgi:DNA-binding response OmpR family regulator
MMRTLILDDEPNWLAVHPDSLHASTLTEALDIIQAGGVELVIVNARMMEAVRPLVQAGGRVEVATSLPSTREAVRAYLAGAVDYFVKDFRPQPATKADQAGLW